MRDSAYWLTSTESHGNAPWSLRPGGPERDPAPTGRPALGGRGHIFFRLRMRVELQTLNIAVSEKGDWYEGDNPPNASAGTGAASRSCCGGRARLFRETHRLASGSSCGQGGGKNTREAATRGGVVSSMIPFCEASPPPLKLPADCPESSSGDSLNLAG